jgi:hypothetical protein
MGIARRPKTNPRLWVFTPFAPKPPHATSRCKLLEVEDAKAPKRFRLSNHFPIDLTLLGDGGVGRNGAVTQPGDGGGGHGGRGEWAGLTTARASLSQSSRSRSKSVAPPYTRSWMPADPPNGLGVVVAHSRQRSLLPPHGGIQVHPRAFSSRRRTPPAGRRP